MKIAVVGSGGQLGSALRLTDPGHEVTWLTRADLDLSQASDFAALAAYPCIINCAARTDVDAQEEDAEGAWAVNGRGVERLGTAAKGRLIHVSTDYVYGSSAPRRPLTPADRTDPDTVYGASKRAGEEALADRPDTLIVRTAWLFSGDCLPEHRDFVSTMLGLAREGKPARVVNDQIGSPTFAFDLARGLWEAAESSATGIVHGVGRGQASWFDVARAAYEAAGADPSLVTPCTSEAFERPARRPPWSVLSPESWEHAGFSPFLQWNEGVRSAVTGRIS